jgi:Flp pilus assembly protein TadD
MRTKTGRSLPGVKTELKAAGSTATTSKAEPTVPKLLRKCQELLTQCDYELASKFIERVLDKSPGNSEALEYKGIVQVETGDVDGAREVSV